jgi:hypothetical protein
MSFKGRVVMSFLLVPWLPILFLLPYSLLLSTLRPVKPSHVNGLLWLSFGIAVFTYFLEVTILIPFWRSAFRTGKASLLRFVTVGFTVAFVCSFTAIGLLAGIDFIFDWYFAVLVPLFSFIGCSEAALFWLIVRPDKYKSAVGNKIEHV